MTLELNNLLTLPVTATGSCHCGAVRFQVTIRSLDVIDCNCSICEKKGLLHLICEEDDFELLGGEKELIEYQFNTGAARHLFCSVCGVQAFYRPRSHPEHWDVNVRCLGRELQKHFCVRQFNGRNWEEHVESIQ
jgi:hypothetical protein